MKYKVYRDFQLLNACRFHKAEQFDVNHSDLLNKKAARRADSFSCV